MNKWIISRNYDLLFLFFPGIIVLFLSKLVSYELLYSVIFFIVFNFIDSGHTYTTLLLTISNKEYKNRLTVPIFVFIGITVWYFVFDLRLFLEFIAFFTLYHNLRQNYGIFRWYSSKANNNSTLMDNLFNALMIIPIILFYCRNLKNDFIITYNQYAGSLFIKNHISVAENFMGISFYSILGKYFLILFIVLLSLSAILFFLDFKRRQNSAQIICFYFFIYIYFTSFIFSNNLNELLSGLVISHGIIYVAMVIKRIKQNSKNTELVSAIVFITILLLFIGGLLHFFEEIVIFDVKGFKQKHEYLYYVLLLLYSLPILTHYIWDAEIWKAKDESVNKMINS